MIKKDFLLLIMNCKKYANKAIFQKKTWLLHLPPYLKYYHVIGNEELETEYKFEEETNILWVKIQDDYNSLPKKVIAAYSAVKETFDDFKYIYKTDDDQILVKPNFFDIITKLILTKIPKSHYGGFVVDVKTPYLSKYNLIHSELPNNLIVKKTKYCSGRFYFLSKEAVLDLITKKDKIDKEFLEDYAIGFYIDPFFKENILHIGTNHFFTDISSDFVKDNNLKYLKTK
jgi:hypothetical protein